MDEQLQIYVTRDKDIRAAVIRLFEKKTGERHEPHQDCNCTGDMWLKNSGQGVVWVGGHITDRKEINIAQLEDMPDYSKPPKEMTLPEIIKELGYEVKIVK